jgi:hypothetical protein
MFSQHTTTIGWGCEICGDEETFSREADLVEHLADIHLDSIPRDELDLFVDMGAKQSVEGLSSCPVCSWTPGVEGVVSNDQLIDHVAEHIHSFALRSLPWAPDKIDYSQGTFKSSIEKVETWFSACNPGAETFEHTPTLQTQGSHSNRDNYFDKHEYFAESSKASSDAATPSGFSNHDDSDEDESSIRMVKDLGFGAAASNLPAIFNTPGEYDAEISDSLKAVFEKRKSRHSSQSQKTSGTTHILLNLQKEIEDELEWSQHDHKEFLPLQSFEGIFNPRTIALLLDQTYHFATHKELENKFASIMNRKSGRSRRRTLAVLVLMSKVAHIEDFIREDIWDDDLPVEHLAENAKGYVVTRTSDNDKLMNTWSRPDINLFCSYQKIFFVPFFDMRADRLCFYELQSNIRLPWMVFQHKTNGGFGVVHRVEIHPDHHNFPVSNVSIRVVLFFLEQC